jgi:prepilin-type N-terminal cleavage/methylation domain-containing protein
MHSNCRKFTGFSLLEVIIAVGIFAVAVSAMLGLLPALTRQSAISTDTLTGLRLPDALRMELQRMAAAGGFDALAGQARPLATPLPDTCLLVATRDAARLHALNYQPPPAADRMAGDSQYFLIEVWSFSESPLAFEAGGAVLALHIRVSWPYRIPGSLTATPLASREQVGFNLALNR